MKSLKELLKNRQQQKKNAGVVTEHQTYAIYLAQKLNDMQHLPLYMRLAKTEDRSILEAALRYVIDSNAQNIKTLFLWKLKKIKEEQKVILTQSKNSIQIATSALEDNKVIIVPTDTVYGLAARLYSIKAIKKIYQIKKRPIKQPSAVLVASAKQAFSLWNITEIEKQIIKTLINKFWHGGLTIIAKAYKLNLLPKYVVEKDKQTIGLRMPKHKWLINVIKKLDEPLVATSVNIHGQPTPIHFNDISLKIKQKVAYIFKDWQEKLQGTASTVIAVSGKKIKIVRQGTITQEALEKPLKEKSIKFTFVKDFLQ